MLRLPLVVPADIQAGVMRVGLFPLWGVALAGLAGCPVGAPSEAPDGRATFEVRTRHTDLVTVEVFLPDDAAHPPPNPALVLLQGGRVPTSGYAWLAERFSSRGVVVALPAHPLDMAIFAVGNGEAARDLLVAPPEGSVLQGRVDPSRIAVGGHSLGGVVATKLAVAGDFSALALLASYPDPADEDRVRAFRRPVLSLAAERDCQAALEDVAHGAAMFSGPTVLAVAEGAGHFQFTDDGEEDARRGCPADTSLVDAHARIEDALFTFLVAAWSGGGTQDLGAVLDAMDGIRVEAP